MQERERREKREEARMAIKKQKAEWAAKQKSQKNLPSGGQLPIASRELCEGL